MPDTGARIYDFFRQRGVSPAAAAGVIGNLRQESGLNPNAPGGGLIQGQGGRTSHGSLEQQLHGIWGELTGPERGTLRALRGAKTPQQAALIFSKRFERPGEPRNDLRTKYAAEALQRYGRREAGHAQLAGQLAGEIAPHLQPEAGPSEAQSADLAQYLSSALASRPASAPATAPVRPATAGGPVSPSGVPRIPQAAQEPAQRDPAALLSVLSKLGADASPLPEAQAQPTGPLPTASPQAQGKLAGIVAEANHIGNAHVPYLWGGGHSGKVLPSTKVTPLDCSGAVSAALGINPKVSGEYESWGAPGKGKNVTVWANADHVLLEVNGRFWGTSHSNPGGGAGWIKPGTISKSYLQGFTPRHPGNL